MNLNGSVNAMKRRLRSLRFRILLPVLIIALCVITLLNTLYSSAYNHMILQQEQEKNAVGFAAVSNSVEPLISNTVNEVRGILLDKRVVAYATHQFDSDAELVHARVECADCLQTEIESHDRVCGLLFMRGNGSLFGTLRGANLFLDDPEDNLLPANVKEQILNVPMGETVWVGPVSGATIYGFGADSLPQSFMIAAWKSVNVSYGECYEMMLLDESVFDDIFSALQDERGSLHLFTENQVEIWHTSEGECKSQELLIRESNSGEIFHDEDNNPLCAFSMTMDSPTWILVREVPMQAYEHMVESVSRMIALIGGVVLLIVLVGYELWLRSFMRQFRSLLDGIVRMGQGDLEPMEFERTSIVEFGQMRDEINRTRVALGEQMETIRRMEREQMEQENAKKEQARIAKELEMAREIQLSALPQDFPPFPSRGEFELFASMTPAREVGGDFYDFFLIDDDHLALMIADVSDKGIPATLFMMASKTLIRSELMIGCDPATALGRANVRICEHNPSNMFVTVWLAVVEISTGKGVSCNAGHEHPCLRRADVMFEIVRYPHGFVIGGMSEMRYTNREFELHPGDCVFVYTDGVPEAASASEGMFGEERLVEALNQHADAGPEELIRGVREAVSQFAGDEPQSDDITMLCLRFNGA